MEHKTRIDETNNMRNLMGLSVFTEEEKVEGVDAPESAEALKKDEEDHGDVVNEDDVIGTGDTGASDEDGAPESEEGEKKFDADEDKTNIAEDSEGEETYHYGEDEGEDKKEEEDLEDEEKMEPKDHIREIERHLDALKDDMDYDEDHEDRDEEGTDFREQRTFNIIKNGKSITLTESEVKKIVKANKGTKIIKLNEKDLNTIVKRVVNEEDDKWMQDADEDIEKRGTEGIFHKFCVDEGFKDGCSPDCWAAAKRKGGPWGRRAGLAKAFCESKH